VAGSYPSRERIKVINSIQTALDQRENFWSKEYRFRLSDDSYADIFDRGYILYNEQGEPVRMIGAMMDITERKQRKTHCLRVNHLYKEYYNPLQTAF